MLVHLDYELYHVLIFHYNQIGRQTKKYLKKKKKCLPQNVGIHWVRCQDAPNCFLKQCFPLI